MPRLNEHPPTAEVQPLWEDGAWPCFSPDGRRLAFSVRPERADSRLALIDLERPGEPRFLTPAGMRATRPAWLDGGERIVFNRDAGGLATVDAATGEIEPFLPAAPPAVHPCAYPNEEAVAVVRFLDSDRGRQGVLYKLAPGAAEPVERLTDPAEVCAGRPGVGPDGRSVVFAGNAGRFDQGGNQLWIVTPGEKARRVEPGSPAPAQGRAPRWSPDGRWIAFTSTRPEPAPDESTPKAIWIVDPGGREAHRLTDSSFDALHVAWSPGQERLVCGGFGCGLGIVELPERFR